MIDQGNFAVTKKAFQLVHNATELLLEAYNSGFVDLNDLDEKNGRLAEHLQHSQILFATNHGKMRLNPTMTRLISIINQDEKSRYINTDFQGQFEELKISTDRYLKIRHNNSNEALRVFSDIETIVYEVMQSVVADSMRLRTRISTQFGYVRTIEDKKIENERAIVVAERLVSNIKVFSYEQLKKLSGTNARLLNLLCKEFNSTIDKCHAELQITLTQLRTLLTEYRVQQKKSALVSGFIKYWSLHPEYSPEEHTEGAFLPEVLNIAKPLTLHANADIENEAHEEVLCAIIDKTKVKEVADAPVSYRKDPAIVSAGHSPVIKEIEFDELALACDKYLANVIRNGDRKSAQEFYKEEGLLCSTTVWLFVLTSKLVNLEKAHKKVIGYEFKVEHSASIKGAGKRTLKDLECFSKI